MTSEGPSTLGKQLTADGVPFRALRLRSWPEVSHLDPELVFDLSRVCALLAIRPTGMTLIPRLLELPRERVSRIVEWLHLNNHLEAGWANSTGKLHDVPVPSNAASGLNHAVEGASSEKLGQLWRRLAGRG